MNWSPKRSRALTPNVAVYNNTGDQFKQNAGIIKKVELRAIPIKIFNDNSAINLLPPQ